MPTAIPLSVRRTIVSRRLEGQPLTRIAKELGLSYDTVRNLWRRYRRRGPDAMVPDYHRCGRTRPPASQRIARAASWLRRHHLDWGAGKIRERLQEHWKDQTIPATRTLQRYFREAGVNRAGGRPARRGATSELLSAANVTDSVSPADLQWMLRVLQCAASPSEIRPLFENVADVEILTNAIKHGPLRDRNKALAVVARQRGITIGSIADFLFLYPRTVSSYCSTYRIYGCDRLFRGFYPRESQADDEHLRHTVFEVLHTPPKDYDINRTTWRMADLQRVLADKGHKVCAQVIRKIIRSAGYNFRKARKALTSNDPEYRQKLAKIQAILSSLGPNERFFSIDEFGPFAVKMQGGRSLVPPGKVRVVPQRQKSKGSLVVTGALELSTNQMTHFYSESKNTAEMLRLLEVLLVQYAGCDKIYLSWDAASWHASKAFCKRIDEVNSPGYRATHKVPYVELAPLPSGAQFLNVIESVFSGMAKAIIHNSDYESVAVCKQAIDRYFAERNAFFQAHPKRAGKVIWGKEETPSEFSSANNCKNRGYHFLGL